jgi:hypothetical protein
MKQIYTMMQVKKHKKICNCNETFIMPYIDIFLGLAASKNVCIVQYELHVKRLLNLTHMGILGY